MRRPTTVELMLLTTVILWALNLTVSRYILTHGFEPLAYSTLRYGAAALIFVGLTLGLERTLRLWRRDAALVLGAAVLLVANQVSFVYALERTTASTVGLILGATPIFAALMGLAIGLERLGARFWLATAVSFSGVALVATGAGGELSGDLLGNVLGIVTAASWAGYSVLITPLMERYSPYRVSAIVLASTTAAIALAGAKQTQARRLRSAGKYGACSRSPSWGRSCSRTSSGTYRCSGSARLVRRWPRTCNLLSLPPSPSFCCRRR
jgi:drug/metabolite transporter (DMT)-like permease